MRKLAIAFLVMAVGGCTHLSGTAYDATTRRPMAGAVFTIGHPGGIGVFDRKTADARGHFDFYVSPTDESHIYVYDPKGDANGAQRVDRSELGENMKVYVRRGGEGD